MNKILIIGGSKGIVSATLLQQLETMWYIISAEPGRIFRILF